MGSSPSSTEFQKFVELNMIVWSGLVELYLKGGGNLDLPPLHQQSHPLQSFNPANWKCQTHANILSLPRLGQWCGNKNCVVYWWWRCGRWGTAPSDRHCDCNYQWATSFGYTLPFVLAGIRLLTINCCALSAMCVGDCCVVCCCGRNDTGCKLNCVCGL
jgi:hypothetical protein